VSVADTAPIDFPGSRGLINAMRVRHDHCPPTAPPREGWLAACTSIVDRLFGFDLRPEEKELLAQRTQPSRSRTLPVVPQVNR
jgi:hypothetical protein